MSLVSDGKVAQLLTHRQPPFLLDSYRSCLPCHGLGRTAHGDVYLGSETYETAKRKGIMTKPTNDYHGDGGVDFMPFASSFLQICQNRQLKNIRRHTFDRLQLIFKHM